MRLPIYESAEPPPLDLDASDVDVIFNYFLLLRKLMYVYVIVIVIVRVIERTQKSEWRERACTIECTWSSLRRKRQTLPF